MLLSDVCLSLCLSVCLSVCLSDVYIGPNSRTERPRKTKIGTEVAHVTCDSDTTFKVKRSKVNLQVAGAYCGGLPHSLFVIVAIHDDDDDEDADRRSAHVRRQEFVSGLSVLSRGNLHEKLLWTFSLYDTNRDGIVTKDEMLDIVSAIYDLMGKYAEPTIHEHTARDHVERVFQVSHAASSSHSAVSASLDPFLSPLSLVQIYYATS